MRRLMGSDCSKCWCPCMTKHESYTKKVVIWSKVSSLLGDVIDSRLCKMICSINLLCTYEQGEE